MKQGEAEECLVSICPRLQTTTDDRRRTTELCELIAYLPLALKIAGSYLAASPNVRAENYLARLRTALAIYEAIEDPYAEWVRGWLAEG